MKDAFDFFLDPSTIMCTAGAVIVFVAFFGCMGALRENTCFLQFVSNLIMYTRGKQQFNNKKCNTTLTLTSVKILWKHDEKSKRIVWNLSL